MKQKKLKLFKKYPAKLIGNVLPTYEDVVRAIHATKSKYRGKSYEEPIKEVVGSLVEIWTQGGSLPIVDIRTISGILRLYHTKYLQVSKSKPQGKKYQAALDEIMVIIHDLSESKM